MAGTTAEAQVAKRCYKNQTAGWLGVVKLDHLGAQVGHPVEPGGTVYLSDDEAILTARAPAQAKDNPFEEQTFLFVDENGQHVEQAMRPLIRLSDTDEADTDERYVPVGDINPHHVAAEAARTGATLEAQEGDDKRLVPAVVQEEAQVPGRPAGEAVESRHSRPEGEPESWVDNPERTAEPQVGSLGGSNESPGDDSDPLQGTGQEEGQGAPPQAPAPQAPGAADEEHASSADSSLSVEETGAAVPPAGEPVEGEFAQHEEVGSPDAPSQGAESA